MHATINMQCLAQNLQVCKTILLPIMSTVGYQFRCDVFDLWVSAAKVVAKVGYCYARYEIYRLQ